MDKNDLNLKERIFYILNIRKDFGTNSSTDKNIKKNSYLMKPEKYQLKN